jgi:hypothetical protein
MYTNTAKYSEKWRSCKFDHFDVQRLKVLKRHKCCFYVVCMVNKMVKLWVAAKSAVIHTGGVERTYRSHTIFLPFSISLVLYLVLLAYRAVNIVTAQAELKKLKASV